MLCAGHLTRVTILGIEEERTLAVFHWKVDVGDWRRLTFCEGLISCNEANYPFQHKGLQAFILLNDEVSRWYLPYFVRYGDVINWLLADWLCAKWHVNHCRQRKKKLLFDIIQRCVCFGATLAFPCSLLMSIKNCFRHKNFRSHCVLSFNYKT